MSEDKWIHDDCGGEVNTNKLYWTCKKCHSFVWVCDCNGNSKVIPSSIVDALQKKIDELQKENDELRKHQIPYGWICHP